MVLAFWLHLMWPMQYLCQGPLSNFFLPWTHKFTDLKLWHIRCCHFPLWSCKFLFYHFLGLSFFSNEVYEIFQFCYFCNFLGIPYSNTSFSCPTIPRHFEVLLGSAISRAIIFQIVIPRRNYFQHPSPYFGLIPSGLPPHRIPPKELHPCGIAPTWDCA